MKNESVGEIDDIKIYLINSWLIKYIEREGEVKIISILVDENLEDIFYQLINPYESYKYNHGSLL